MTNTHAFAKKELEILIQSTPDALVKGFMPEILALVEKFGLSGQSGGSAPYYAKAISQTIELLCLQKPICPITGIDEEWMEVSERMYQNIRCHALFKRFDTVPAFNFKPYYLDAIVFQDKDGIGFTGSALLKLGKEGKAFQKIFSHQYIRQFPFEPRTFYIDVTRVEIGKDDWENYIDDATQLDAAFEYYKNPNEEGLQQVR